MGYIIRIGEAVMVDDGDGIYTVYVNSKALEDAPKFVNDPASEHRNERHPSYSGWHNFAVDVGLKDFFFSKKFGLMREHPGCFVLTENDSRRVKKALENRKQNGRIPGFIGDPMFKNYVELEDPDKYDGNLARLVWLDWWITWALENCKYPAIYNS